MDINISANTLFHFTSNKKSLLSILENGLYVRYSLENFESLISDKAEIVLPMTCFCDIPLSQVKRHTETYGKYAIGLTKSWGMHNEVNPVIYTYPGSSTAKILSQLSNNLENFFNILDEPNDKEKTQSLNHQESQMDISLGLKIHDLYANLSHFIKYIKPYEGRFYRNGNYTEKPVKFYEEREWRYIPSKTFFDAHSGDIDPLFRDTDPL